MASTTAADAIFSGPKDVKRRPDAAVVYIVALEASIDAYIAELGESCRGKEKEAVVLLSTEGSTADRLRRATADERCGLILSVGAIQKECGLLTVRTFDNKFLGPMSLDDALTHVGL